LVINVVFFTSSIDILTYKNPNCKLSIKTIGTFPMCQNIIHKKHWKSIPLSLLI
jgi:hypothetical protein